MGTEDGGRRRSRLAPTGDGLKRVRRRPLWFALEAAPERRSGEYFADTPRTATLR